MKQSPFLRRENFLNRSAGIFLEVAVGSTTPNLTEGWTIGETFHFRQLQEKFFFAQMSTGGAPSPGVK
jgi:hypothetical protein